MPTPGHFTTIDQSGRARVTRQEGESYVVPLIFQFSTELRILVHRLLFARVALYPAFLRHSGAEFNCF